MDVAIVLQLIVFTGVLNIHFYAGVVYNAKRGTSIAIGKSVRMINTLDYNYYDWNAEFAVDGNLTNDADKCHCCAATQYSIYPWFEVDLGRRYRISYINVYGRNKPAERQSFKNLNMYASPYKSRFNKPPFYENGVDSYFLNITLPVPVITQYVTLLVLDQTVERLLLICELQLFEGECNYGTFGEFCNNECYCEGETCDGKTGICPSGQCLLGYRGANCSQECNNGTYGRGCTESCGFCVNGSVCDKITGSCSGCSPGYMGDVCKQECPAGEFGDQCLSNCGHCLNGQPCDHVTGDCVMGCQLGFSRPLCNEPCPYGTYGIDCRETCGKCLSKEACNITNGHCSTEGCVGDFVPPLCSTSRADDLGGKESLAITTAGIGGIISGVVIMLVAVVIVAVVIKIRRKKKENIYAQPNVEFTANEIRVYDTLEAHAPDAPDYTNASEAYIYLNVQK